MKPDQEDARLREAIASLRQANERMTPAFSTTWSSAQRQLLAKVPGRWRHLRAALAGVALVAIAVAWQFRQPRHVEPAPHPPPAISSTEPMAISPVYTLARWRSPTDFLLASPNQELLRGMPHFGLPIEHSFIINSKQET
jgi:anti-sigma-K factor RskA